MKNKNENNIIETSVESTIATESKKSFKDILSSIGGFFKKCISFLRHGKIRNQAFLKRGGYSLIITAVVLTALIAFNWLVGLLSTQFHLELDLTENAQYSMTDENIDFIEDVKYDVNITVVGNKDKETFVSYSNYFAQEFFGMTVSNATEYEDMSDYFEQTYNLIAKYKEYNDKINIEYIDFQSPEYSTIQAEYPEAEFYYGDIIVDCTINNNERVKILTFTDIYAVTEGSSSYYGTSYKIASNKVESALTSAISYVTSTESKKVAIISGHSTKPYSSAYKDILLSNNYEITEITATTIAEISSDYDAIIISAPTIDFIPSELEIISKFLDNDGKLNKGLIFFADAASPYLPNLYGFLKQWGVSIEEGVIFETDSENAYAKIKTTFGTFPVALEDDKITQNIGQGAITDYNVPMKVCDPATTARKATALMKTTNTTVIAPLGISAEWAPSDSDTKQQFDTVVQSVETARDDDGNTVTSYVMAFASVEYIQSTWASYNELCNQNIVMAVSDRAAHVTDTDITFTSKFIENDSFIADESAGSTINTIFVILVPLLTIAFGIVIFVRRRNAR